MAADSGRSVCSCVGCCAQLPARLEQVLDAQRSSAQQQASLAVKLEHLHTLINVVLEDTTGMAAPKSTSISAPGSMAACEVFSSPLRSCAACHVPIRIQLENLCYAQGILVQHQASLATKLVQLRTLSRATLHHLLDAENNASPGEMFPSMAVPQGRPRGTKRRRPEHYSAGPWPSEMTSTVRVNHEQPPRQIYDDFLRESHRLRYSELRKESVQEQGCGRHRRIMCPI